MTGLEAIVFLIVCTALMAMLLTVRFQRSDAPAPEETPFDPPPPPGGRR